MAYDPKKVHKVQHNGRFYKMNAYNHTHPSPQRTPVIFQAGASKAGQGFAAKHAEAVFINGTTTAHVSKQVQAVREEAFKNGRDGSKIKFFLSFLPTIGRTHEEAVAKFELAKSYAYSVGGIALVSSYIGLDLSKYPLDEPFEFKGDKSDASIYGWIETVQIASAEQSDGPWTPRKLGGMMLMGPASTSPVGTATEVADVLERWMDETDIDGFNMQRKFLHQVHDGTLNKICRICYRRELQGRC